MTLIGLAFWLLIGLPIVGAVVIGVISAVLMALQAIVHVFTGGQR